MVDFLERGVRKFKREGYRAHRALFRKLARSQSPRVLFITCADSRLVPALITQLNVIVQIERLKTHPTVARRLRQGKLALHGWVYDIREGGILQLSERTGEFLPWP